MLGLPWQWQGVQAPPGVWQPVPCLPRPTVWLRSLGGASYSGTRRARRAEGCLEWDGVLLL